MKGRRTGADVFVGRADAVSKREIVRMKKMIRLQRLDEADMTGISYELNLSGTLALQHINRSAEPQSRYQLIPMSCIVDHWVRGKLKAK
jgi:hypothetical protein